MRKPHAHAHRHLTTQFALVFSKKCNDALLSYKTDTCYSTASVRNVTLIGIAHYAMPFPWDCQLFTSVFRLTVNYCGSPNFQRQRLQGRISVVYSPAGLRPPP